MKNNDYISTDFGIDLRVIGATIVRESTLPAGPGVSISEVGLPGPWYGVRYADGAIEGWARDPVQLQGLVRPDIHAYRMRIRNLEKQARILGVLQDDVEATEDCD